MATAVAPQVDLEEPDEDDSPVLARRPIVDDGEMDITPMIDITFLLLIYFLVASVPDSQTAVELPSARFGKGVSANESVVLTVVDGGLGTAPVYLAEGRIPGTELSEDAETQQDEIEAAVNEGVQRDKYDVLIKAERGVAHREVARVAKAASRVEGIRLHIGVLEEE